MLITIILGCIASTIAPILGLIEPHASVSAIIDPLVHLDKYYHYMYYAPQQHLSTYILGVLVGYLILIPKLKVPQKLATFLWIFLPLISLYALMWNAFNEYGRDPPFIIGVLYAATSKLS